MAEINKVVKSLPPEEHLHSLRISLAEITDAKKQFIGRNMTLSPEEFGALFGNKVDWALDRMRDGSVIVLDEYAKTSPNGTKFSKSARICANSIESYRDTMAVPIV